MRCEKSDCRLPKQKPSIEDHRSLYAPYCCWRGFLQRHFENSLGRRTGWLLATAVYASIHLASGNPILVLAAGVCGLFWGWLYLRYRSMLLNAVSHTLWDIAAFLLFPFH